MSLERWPRDVPTLTDGVVTLRAWTADDADGVRAACGDPEVERWTPLPAPYLREHAVAFVERGAPRRWATGQAAPFAVVAADGADLVGSCGLVRIDERDLVAEIGYWVAPWARGRTVAQRAVRLVRDWAFTELDLARIELLIDPDNVASRAVAERVGCVAEGVLRSRTLHRGVRRDLVLYAAVRQ